VPTHRVRSSTNAHPYTGLLLWVNTPGVVGILVLQTLTAIATVVYFLRRNRSVSTPLAVAAGIASSLLLTIATYILVDSVGLLTNAPTTVNVVLVSIVPATLLAGGLLARWLRGRRPATYARIGEDDGDTHPTPEAIPA
jgi:hypothetical protein